MKVKLFCLYLVHHYSGTPPFSVLLDHHPEDTILPPEALAFAIVAFDGRVISQKCYVSQKMHLNVIVLSTS